MLIGQVKPDLQYIMYAFFAYVAVMFAAHLGAGRDGKEIGFSSRTCLQAGSASKKNTFLLVEKGTTPANHKITWQTMWFGC